MKEEFTAIIQQQGKRTVLHVPFDPNQRWGIKARHDITGSINGAVVRGPLEAEGNGYILPLGTAWQRDHGFTAGATVTVVLRPEGPQIAAMANDLQDAFAAAPKAVAFFNSLPTFYRKNYLRWVEGAKRPETRVKRIEEMISLLKAEKRERYP